LQNRLPGRFHLSYSHSMTSLSSSAPSSTAPLKRRPSKSSLRPTVNPVPMVFTAKVVHVPSGSAVFIKLARNVKLEEARTNIEKKFQEVESLELRLSLTLQSTGALSLCYRNPLLSPSSTTGRPQSSGTDASDNSLYARISTEDDWAYAVASIGFGEKMALRIFEE